MKLLKRIYNWFRSRHMYVIADASDNSITLSRSLFRHMGGLDLDQAKVFVFKISSHDKQPVYAFTINPSFEQETQLADIQYNSKYKTIGFETLNPTVNRIFYDYGLEPLIKVKLTVKPRKAGDYDYYEILPPAPQAVKPS